MADEGNRDLFRRAAASGSLEETLHALKRDTGSGEVFPALGRLMVYHSSFDWNDQRVLDAVGEVFPEYRIYHEIKGRSLTDSHRQALAATLFDIGEVSTAYHEFLTPAGQTFLGQAILRQQVNRGPVEFECIDEEGAIIVAFYIAELHGPEAVTQYLQQCNDPEAYCFAVVGLVRRGDVEEAEELSTRKSFLEHPLYKNSLQDTARAWVALGKALHRSVEEAEEYVADHDIGGFWVYGVGKGEALRGKTWNDRLPSYVRREWGKLGFIQGLAEQGLIDQAILVTGLGLMHGEADQEFFLAPIIQEIYKKKGLQFTRDLLEERKRNTGRNVSIPTLLELIRGIKQASQYHPTDRNSPEKF